MIKWRPCENPRCTAQVTTIDGQIMSREWSQNGAKLLGYRFHNCKVTTQESQPVERVYHAKWIRKGQPEWVRYTGPTKSITTGLLRPPDMTAPEYEREGSKTSQWERAGIFVSDTIKWTELSSTEITAGAEGALRYLLKKKHPNSHASWEM